MAHSVVAPRGGALHDVVARGLDDVEELIGATLESADALADDVAKHLFVAGGKRIRPLITLTAAELGDGASADAVKAAAVVELTHLASLYHDDVMDSAPTRRGAPSAHEVWGNTVAILTGDLLFARASALVAELGPDAVLLQAKTFERLCLGQLHETVGPRPGDDPVQHYLDVIGDKTGSLIGTSGRFGALYGGCPPEQVEAVTRFCEGIGVAFQLADDVLDLTSDAETSGKTPGTDLREGVPTLPLLLARQDAERGDDDAKSALAVLEEDLSDDAALARAVSALRDLPATRRAQAEAQRVADEAIGALGALPESEAKQALEDIATSLVNRSA